MEQNSSPDKQVVHLRVARDLHDHLVTFANQTERSLNGAVVYLLRRGLAGESPLLPQGHRVSDHPLADDQCEDIAPGEGPFYTVPAGCSCNSEHLRAGGAA